jgi:hypothetical protein
MDLDCRQCGDPIHNIALFLSYCYSYYPIYIPFLLAWFGNCPFSSGPVLYSSLIEHHLITNGTGQEVHQARTYVFRECRVLSDIIIKGGYGLSMGNVWGGAGC